MRRWPWIAAAFLLLGLASLDGPAPAVNNPVRAEMTRRLADIYAVAETTTRVSVDAVTAGAIRTSADTFLGVLPLDADVRARVRGRVASDVAVDEIAPFLLFLKELYDRRQAGIAGFDDRPGRPPGSAAPSEPSPAGGGLPSPAVLAQLVTLYDAVWLRDAAPDAPLAQTLTCDRGDARLAERAAAASPVVRDLLGALAVEGDAGKAVERVRSDDAVLKTVSTSLVEFLDAEVCKHYRVFASRQARQRQLGAWLAAGIDADDPVVWEWLDWADSRPLAVQVVVDGLQGHLVRALAERDAAFFRGVLAGHAVPRPSVAAVPGPPMTLDALRRYADGDIPDQFPTFRAILADGGVVAQGISTTPTISVRNLPVVMTGAPVAGPRSTGIPNFHFVDRTTPGGRPWYFYGNDALQLTALTTASGMTTMFARLDRLDTMSCNSQYDELAGYSFDGFLNLAVGERIRDFGDALCIAELRRRSEVEVQLRALRGRLRAHHAVLAPTHRPWELYDRWGQREARADAQALAAEIALRSTDGLPDFLQYYNPWPDHFAHAVGPYSDPIIGAEGEYARLDWWLGQLMDGYGGARERTVFGMAGDHGLVPVAWIVSPEQLVFGALEKAGNRLVVRKISSDEGEGPKLTDRFAPPSMRGIDAVVASTAGGNYMVDLFLDQGESWSRQPVLGELRAWKTLAGRTVDIVDEIARRLGDSLDYLVVRTAPCTPDGGAIALWRYRGGARQMMEIVRTGDRIRVFGDNLVDLPADHPAEADVATWRALTASTRRPDSVVQLAHLYDTDRAGTINLFPVEGVGYNTVVPGRHAGEAYAEKDAFVGVWGEPVRAHPGVPAAAVNGQVAPTLYGWLTGARPAAGEDGWGYAPIWAEGGLTPPG